jgi:hypothetical protein
MGPRSRESFHGPLMRRHARLPISFGGISLFSMEDCAPFAFLGNWALMALYLCSRFCIFYKTILEEYVSQVVGPATSFNLAYVQRKMVYNLQLGICTFLLNVW